MPFKIPVHDNSYTIQENSYIIHTYGNDLISPGTTSRIKRK